MLIYPCFIRYTALCALTILTAGFVRAQDTVTSYLNKDHEPCPKAEAYFFRKAWKEGGLWRVQDTYGDGKVRMTGSFSDAAQKLRTGPLVYYNASGSKDTAGSYANGLKQGLWECWYRNGQLYWRGKFEKGKMEGLWEFWNDDGQPNARGTMAGGAWNGLWTGWDKQGKMRYEANYRNGKLDGPGKWYWPNGQMSADEVFVNDSLVRGRYWEADGTALTATALPLQQAAFPTDGETGLKRFLKERLVYPKEAQKNNINGRVLVRFVVEKDGTLSDIKVVEQVNPLLDAEAVRVVKQMPLWKPGRVHNLPARVSYTLPIIFEFRD